jgi:hypothetical protein
MNIRSIFDRASFVYYVSSYGLNFLQAQRPIFGINPIDGLEYNELMGYNALPTSEAEARSRVIIAALDTDYQAHLNRAINAGFTIPSEARQAVENTFIVWLKAAVPNIVNGGITCFLMTDGDSNYSRLNVWPNPLTNAFDVVAQVNGHGAFVTSIGWYAVPQNTAQLETVAAWQDYYNNTEAAFMIAVSEGDDTVTGDILGVQNTNRRAHATLGRVNQTQVAAQLFTEAAGVAEINIVATPTNKRQVFLVNNNYVAPAYKFKSLDSDINLSGDRTVPEFVPVPVDFTAWTPSNPVYIATGNGFVNKIRPNQANQFAEQINVTWQNKRLASIRSYTLPPPATNNTNGTRIVVTDGVNSDDIWISNSPVSTRQAPYIFLTNTVPNGWINTVNGEVVFNFVNKTVRVYPTKTGIDTGSSGGVALYFEDLIQRPVKDVIFPKNLLSAAYFDSTQFSDLGTNWTEVWWTNSGSCLTVLGDRKTLFRPSGTCANSRITGFTWGQAIIKISNATETFANQSIHVAVNLHVYRWNQVNDSWTVVSVPVIQTVSARFYTGGIIEFYKLNNTPFTNSLTSGDTFYITPQSTASSVMNVQATFERIEKVAIPIRTSTGALKLFVYGGTLNPVDEDNALDEAFAVTEPATGEPPEIEVPSLITFRRETSGSRLDQNNNWRLSVIDLPRQDYYESLKRVGGICADRCPLLLFEPQKRNNVADSELFPFVNDEWEAAQFQATDEHQARIYTVGIAFADQPIKTEVLAPSSPFVTSSVFVRLISRTAPIFGFSFNGEYFFVNILTGLPDIGFAPNSGTVAEYGSIWMGADFYRVWVRFSAAGAGTYGIGYMPQRSEIAVNQWQVEGSERGAYVPTNPIFTTGGLAIRQADQAIITDLYGKGFYDRPDEGSFYAEFANLDGSFEWGNGIAEGNMPMFVATNGDGLRFDLEFNLVTVNLNGTSQSLPMKAGLNRLFWTWRNGRYSLSLNKTRIDFTYEPLPNGYIFEPNQLNINYYDLIDRGAFRFGLRALVFYPTYHE